MRVVVVVVTVCVCVKQSGTHHKKVSTRDGCAAPSTRPAVATTLISKEGEGGGRRMEKMDESTRALKRTHTVHQSLTNKQKIPLGHGETQE